MKSISLCILIVLLIWYALSQASVSDGCCDMDCEHCPFPECSEEDKASMRKMIENSKINS